MFELATNQLQFFIFFKHAQIPNKFVVGYGLDFDQAYRTIPFVAVLDSAAYKH